MSNPLSERVPQPDRAQDIVNVVGQTALNLIPFVGGAVATAVAGVLAVQSANETNELIGRIATVVDDLTGRVDGLTLESIASEPRFLATAEKVVRAAREQPDQEHRERLIRALRHAGPWSQQDRYAVDRMTDLLTRVGPIHIFLLRFFANPLEWLMSNANERWSRGQEYTTGGNMIRILGEYVFPDGVVPITEVARIVSELQRESLMPETRDGFLTTNMTGNGLIEPRLTEFGQTFLKFAEGSLEP